MIQKFGLSFLEEGEVILKSLDADFCTSASENGRLNVLFCRLQFSEILSVVV